MDKKNQEKKNLSRHEAAIERRRKFYRENREAIRERDNATQRRLRRENEERYKEYMRRFLEKEKQREKAYNRDDNLYLKNNPDYEKIMEKIKMEQKE